MDLFRNAYYSTFALFYAGVGYFDVSFFAALDYDPSVPGDAMVFNVVPLNPGGHYDVTSGIYTVPIDGVYEFIVQTLCINDEERFLPGL